MSAAQAFALLPAYLGCILLLLQWMTSRHVGPRP